MKSYLFLLLLLVVASHSQELLEPKEFDPLTQATMTIDAWGSNAGDSLIWRMPGYDAQAWPVVGATGVWKLFGDSGEGVRWYRRTIYLEEDIPLHRPFMISLPIVVSAYEVYWDGVLLGGSGVVGDARTEQAGESSQMLIIPAQRLYRGTHTLSLRVSNHTTLSGTLDYPIKLGYFSNLIRTSVVSQGLSLFLAGIFFITALFHLVVFATPLRRRSYIIFSLFALACAAHIILAAYLAYGSIPVKHYYSLAFVADLFWFGMMVFMPLFLLSHFNAQYRLFTGTMYTVVTLVVVLLPRLALYEIIPIYYLPLLDGLNRFYALFLALVAIAIAFGASLRKRDGARTILIGLWLFLAGVVISSYYGSMNGWSIGFAFLNVFITIAVARQMADQRRTFHQGELRSTRLELELLKKHIQPHFLLNSLNSIVAWIEEEPRVAAELVNALSRELRLLMGFSGESLIPLPQEIKLCRTHLEVMNLRQEKELSFRVVGDCEGIWIPPLILHTLVENGISHGFRKIDKGEFVLTCKRRGNYIRLILTNTGANSRSKNAENGTGNLYIVSRLKEAFGMRWAFQAGPGKTAWRAMIRFRAVEK